MPMRYPGYAAAALLFSLAQNPAMADPEALFFEFTGDSESYIQVAEVIEAGRHDERHDRRDCRRDEGAAGHDKRECKREEVRDGPRGHQDDRQEDREDNRDDREDCRDEEGLVGHDKRKCKRD